MSTPAAAGTQPDYHVDEPDSVARFDAAVTGQGVVYASPESKKRTRLSEETTPAGQGVADASSPPGIIRIRGPTVTLPRSPQAPAVGFATAKEAWVQQLKSNYILVIDDFECPGCEDHDDYDSEAVGDGLSFGCLKFKAKVLEAIYMDSRFTELVHTIKDEVFDATVMAQEAANASPMSRVSHEFDF